jgi:hypothetical protein
MADFHAVLSSLGDEAQIPVGFCPIAWVRLIDPYLSLLAVVLFIE